jgi:hypothetical protein
MTSYHKSRKNTILENIAQLKGLTIVAIKSIEYGSIFPLRRLTLLKVPFAPILSCLLNYEYIYFKDEESCEEFTLAAYPSYKLKNLVNIAFGREVGRKTQVRESLFCG